MNKKLIKLRFQKSLKNYDANAVCQKQMAEKLIAELKKLNLDFSNILEIGCGTGLLTKNILATFNPKKFYALDLISECGKLIKNLFAKTNFICADVEELKQLPENLNLIISNATFQWLDSLENLLQKISISLKPNQICSFTTFGPKNFLELQNLGLNSLNYFSSNQIQIYAQKNYFEIMHLSEEILELKFNSPLEILKHIKLTGTNGLETKPWTKKDITKFADSYAKKKNVERYSANLTYNPIYVILRKKP